MKKILLIGLLTAICGMAGAQDLIVLRKAGQIRAKVLRVSSAEVEFRKTENPGGPVYALPISDILYIQYPNGYKDLFSEPPVRNPELATGPGPAHMPEGKAGYSDATEQGRLVPLRKPRFKHDFDKYPHYQGEISAGYGFGVGNLSEEVNTNRVVFETVHGIRINPFLFAGVGAGFNYFYQNYELYNDYAGTIERYSGAGVVPAFVNSKGYYPVNERIAVYLSLDLGAALPVCGYLKDLPTQFYTAVGPGINFCNGKNRLRGDFSLRFQHMGDGTNAVLFRIGFGF